MNNLIYVVEDNKVYNKLVVEYLSKKNFHNVKAFYSGEECLKAISSGENPDVVIQDYYMDGMNGLQVLQRVKKKSPKTEFIFLTGNESMEVAVNSIKYGAYDYIIKDEVALDKANDKVTKILRLKNLENRNKQIRKYMTITVVVLVLIVIFSVLIYMVDIFNIK